MHSPGQVIARVQRRRQIAEELVSNESGALLASFFAYCSMAELLQQALSQKKREAEDLFGGTAKRKRKAELEQAATARLRQEEAEEAHRKGRKAPSYQSAELQNASRFHRYALEQASVRTDAEGELPPHSDAPLGELAHASPDAVTHRLRALAHPARLFAESEHSRKLRLSRAESDLQVTDDAAGTGQRHVKSANGISKSPSHSHQQQQGNSSGAGVDDTFVAAAERLKKGQKSIDPGDPEDQVASYFDSVMAEWEAEVESASDEWRLNSIEGIRMRSTVDACRKQLQPLLSKLRNRELSEDLVRGLYIIMRSMKTRNYRNAGDMYVRLSIGNQPWPIGITKVGIHERSARDKLQENKMNSETNANVMADEQTRKYLQSIKRLITFKQRTEPTDPSQSLDFNSGINGWDRQELLEREQKEKKEENMKRITGPEHYAAIHPEFASHDGMRAWDKDTRTMRSILNHAYSSDGQGGTN